MLKRSYLYVLLGLLSLVEVFGQNSGDISGVVHINGDPIPGATVKVASQDTWALSSGNGVYYLMDLPYGNYKLEVRSLGYKPGVFNISHNTESTNFDISLVESVLDMEAVVVTGTMQPTFVSQSPIKVEVMTADHVNTFMPAAASGVVESIALISGVQEVVACGVCFTNSISINGLPGPYTAVLMDGTPIYGNLASVYGLNGIPSMLIDRFEVIKGPSSTLYGSEAVAGVINIITKNPSTQPKLSLDIMGTSHLESFGNLAFAPKMKNATGFVGLNYAYINDFDDVNGDGFSDMASMDRISLFSKWDIKRKSQKPFVISAKYYYEDRRNGVEEFLQDRNYRQLRGDDLIYGESIYTNRVELFGTYGFAFAEGLKLDYSFSTHFQDSYYGSDHYKANQKIAYTNLIWEKQLSDHQLLTGFTSRYQHYDDNTVATESADSLRFNNQPNRQYIPGVFAQDEWSISENFTILGGLRADHYAEHGMILSPRLNAKVRLGQWTTFRSNFGTGFRVVNLFTEDHAFLSGQREVVIAEALQPERSYNFSLNANHIFTLGNSQGSVDADAFFTYFSNKIIPDYDDPSAILYENSSGHAITRGVSLNVAQEFGFPLAINLGLNVQDANETERDSLGVERKRRIEFSPVWSGVFTANYQIKKWKLSMAYTCNVTGTMALPEVYDLDAEGNPLDESRPTRSRPFSIQNFQLNKGLKAGFDVYAGVQNIFNFTQSYSPLVGFNDPNAPMGFSSNFDTSYSYAPIHGREFYLGIKWNLN
ncbi:MAG: TonB-dependent receptor [Cyclobacteriaceae bacterium]